MNANLGIPTQGCILKAQPILPQETCFLKIELGDGTSQFVELTMQQALSLGLNIDAAPLAPLPKPIRPKPKEVKKPNGSIVNLLQSTQYMETDHVILENTPKPIVPKPDPPPNVIYKVVQPEELNLKPNVQVPRGRPKKRPIEVTNPPEVQITPVSININKTIKNARTRSGRITRPPKHIEKDFEKIIIKDEKYSSDITTTEFEPLKTNNKNANEQPLLELVHPKKKRVLPPEHRCPTCDKMYLGRKRMNRHFEKYPDHAPAGLNDKKDDTETWKFLVDMALRCNMGQKARKFCTELTNVIKNARTLSKFLFKPSCKDKEEFYMDEILAEALGLKPGAYTLNEKELTKDLSIYAYLDLNYFDENQPKEEKRDIKTEEKTNAILNPKSNEIINKNSYENGVKTFQESNTNSVVGNSLMELLEMSSNIKDEKNSLISSSNYTKYNVKTTTIKATNNQSLMDPIMFTSNDTSLSNDKSGVSEEKLIDNTSINANHAFNNHIIDFMDLNSSDTLNKSNINILETDLHTNIISTFHENCSNKQSGKVTQNNSSIVQNGSSGLQKDVLDKHITLQSNLLPDELILPDVDAGHVTNILDTSTSSDDIMNVDQFVNERFKNITESVMDIPNTTGLSLDNLDLFQFHGT